MLDAANVQIVTVSTDKANEIVMGRAMHGLVATMLPDPNLELIDQFGLRNLSFNNFKIPGRPGLPVPTTLLVDGDGVIVWMDQSENYTQRSDPDVVRAAITEHLPAGAPA